MKEELEVLKLDSNEQAHEVAGIIRCQHWEIEYKEHPAWANHVETNGSWNAWCLENL
jgi:hypothetical protein